MVDVNCGSEMFTQGSEEGKSRWSEFIGRGEGCGVGELNNFRALLVTNLNKWAVTQRALSER